MSGLLPDAGVLPRGGVSHRIPLARATLVLLAAAGLAGCHHARPAWVLLHPPEVRDESYPRGTRLLPAAPLTEWRAVGAFGDQDACEARRRRDVDDTIDRARAAYGDDAKYELSVRRAVHAVCTRPPSP